MRSQILASRLRTSSSDGVSQGSVLWQQADINLGATVGFAALAINWGERLPVFKAKN